MIQEEWDEDDFGELDDYIEKPVNPKKVLRVNRPILLLTQMTVCAVVLVGAFVFKTIGGDLYRQVHEWFFTNYENSIFTDGKINLDFFETETKTRIESKAENQIESQAESALTQESKTA